MFRTIAILAFATISLIFVMPAAIDAARFLKRRFSGLIEEDKTDSLARRRSTDIRVEIPAETPAPAAPEATPTESQKSTKSEGES